MIISHKHKFIFIKTKKTAGTSIEIALSKICGDSDIITPLHKDDKLYRTEFSNRSAQNFRFDIKKNSDREILRSLNRKNVLKFYSHMPCEEIINYISEDVWENYYKFTIERNPFDKVVSLYYWKGAHTEFDNIYDFLINFDFKNFRGYDMYTIDNKIVVDQIYKYENIDGMLHHLTKKLNLTEELEMPEYKAKSNTRLVRNYKEVLDDKSIELVKKVFKKEIELFNYKY